MQAALQIVAVAHGQKGFVLQPSRHDARRHARFFCERDDGLSAEEGSGSKTTPPCGRDQLISRETVGFGKFVRAAIS